MVSRDEPVGQFGQWLRIDDDALTVVVREYHHDRSIEEPPRLDVDLVGLPPEASPMTDEEATRKLYRTIFMSNFWMTAREWFPELVEDSAINQFHVDASGTDKRSEDLALAADVQYTLGSWRLAADEALVIEGLAPDSPYWVVQVMDRWLETADFRSRCIHLNDSNVTIDEAGRYRIVVAHSDPGHADWLDTGGRGEGYMAFRWVHAPEVETPTTRVVKADGLQKLSSP